MTHSKIKMIALDIDGTLLGKDFIISKRVKEAIKKASQMGVKVVISTGRMFSAARPIAEELELETPIITYQGAIVRDSENIYMEKILPDNIFLSLIKELKTYDDIQINTYVGEDLYVEKETEMLIEYTSIRGVKYHVIPNLEDLKNVIKVVIIHKDPNKASEIRDIFKEKYKEDLLITKSTAIYCEFINNQTSKGKGIECLANLWGIKKSEIMTAGDQENDTEMLKAAGLAIAMGNADEKLKEIADYVTDSVENDGVAKAIEKFVFKNNEK